jgi:AraC-like DNA-binding protein
MPETAPKHWLNRYIRCDHVVRLADADGCAMTCGMHCWTGATPAAWTVTWHRNFDLCYVLQGHGVYIDNHDRRYAFRAGSFFIRRPEVHTLRIDSSEFSEMFLSLPPISLTFLRAFRSAVVAAPPVIDWGLKHEIAKRYEHLLHAIRETPEPQLARVVLRIMEFYLEVIGHAQSPKKSIIDRACMIIQADPAGRKSMQNIAAELGLGYSNFRRLFAERIGTSPGEYRIVKRIELACEMLASGRTQKHIAFDLGYTDVQGFSRQFRRFMGLSPGEYLRKTHHRPT